MSPCCYYHWRLFEFSWSLSAALSSEKGTLCRCWPSNPESSLCPYNRLKLSMKFKPHWLHVFWTHVFRLREQENTLHPLAGSGCHHPGHDLLILVHVFPLTCYVVYVVFVCSMFYPRLFVVPCSHPVWLFPCFLVYYIIGSNCFYSSCSPCPLSALISPALFICVCVCWNQ